MLKMKCRLILSALLVLGCRVKTTISVLSVLFYKVKIVGILAFDLEHSPSELALAHAMHLMLLSEAVADP